MHRLSEFDLASDVAQAAMPVTTPVMNQDAFLASIEARLTQEMRDLILALQQFNRRAQLISENIPDSAQFCKLVTGLVRLVSLQLAAALGQGLDQGIFFDDGRQYLAQLHLRLNDFIREIDQTGPLSDRGQGAEDY